VSEKRSQCLLVLVVLLSLTTFLGQLNVRASSAGPDKISLDPSIVSNPGATFTQNVNVSYSATPTGALPDVLAMQYVINYDPKVIDVDMSFCQTVGGQSYCGVIPDAYALLFVITPLNVAVSSGRLFVASLGSFNTATGITSPGGVHSTIHWKITGSGTTALRFSASDTFYATSTSSPIDPNQNPSYTTFDGSFSNSAAPPVALFRTIYPGGGTSGVPNQNVTFDGSDSYDPDNAKAPNRGIVSWTWSFGDGTPDWKVLVPRISHNYTIAGTFSLALVVTDGDQRLTGISSPLTSPSAAYISSKNLAPVASFSFSPANPTTSDLVKFDATASHDPDGDTLNYLWDFGDNGSAVNVTATHLFALPGKFIVKLTVSEANVNPPVLTNSTMRTVTVTLGRQTIPLRSLLDALGGPVGVAGISTGVAVAALAGLLVYRKRKGPVSGGIHEELPEEWK
jgi:hypothetical protein